MKLGTLGCALIGSTVFAALPALAHGTNPNVGFIPLLTYQVANEALIQWTRLL